MPSVQKQLVSQPTRRAASNGRKSAWDLAEGIKMLLYGKSGTGKTTLWATFPGPILALICSGGSKPGELRSIDTPEYRKKIDARIVTNSEEFRDQLTDAANFATVILDHGSGLADMLLKEILGIDELPAQRSWGLASQQQYGQLALQCKESFRALLNLSGNVVIVCQERSFGEESQSDILTPTVGAALTPSVTGWLNPACDYVVQTFIRPKMEASKGTINGKPIQTLQRGKGVEYCLRTGPHDIFMTKFRVPKGKQLPETIVDPTYDAILRVIQGR